MFSIKITKSNDNEEVGKTIKNVFNYIFNKINFANPKMISDDNSVELISGSESVVTGGKVVVELLIRKHIVINTSEFNDKSALDRHITKIKHFCDQAKTIEELKYLPINMRD